MKDLIIYKNVITGKFVYGYKIEVKAEDYPLKIDHGNINLDFTLDYVNKDLFNELIMPK
jgi:hypothetical protein